MDEASHSGPRYPLLQTLVFRELHTVIAGLILATSLYIVVRWAAPHIASQDAHALLDKFVGLSWPFFVVVTAFLFYVMGAWIAEIFGFAAPRDWYGIGQGLHWATEACPLVGLLTTFLSLLIALLAYGEAGPGKPETQAVFISQFAIAFGSSISGGVLALLAFTLHRVVPADDEE